LTLASAQGDEFEGLLLQQMELCVQAQEQRSVSVAAVAQARSPVGLEEHSAVWARERFPL